MNRRIFVIVVLLCCCTACGLFCDAAASDELNFGAAPNESSQFVDAETASSVNATALKPGANKLESSPILNTSSVSLDDKHKLIAGDRISFRIEEDRDPPGTPPTLLTVTDSGELNVPYIGLVTVSGKTCQTAADEIKTLLEKDYYFKATIVIGLDQATKVVGRFNINGNVRNPGVYELPVNETFTAGKAITRAGGFADFADKKSVKVIRSVNGQKQTFEVNMVEIWEKGKIEKDIPVLPDDYIFVPQKLINF